MASSSGCRRKGESKSKKAAVVGGGSAETRKGTVGATKASTPKSTSSATRSGSAKEILSARQQQQHEDKKSPTYLSYAISIALVAILVASGSNRTNRSARWSSGPSSGKVSMEQQDEEDNPQVLLQNFIQWFQQHGGRISPKVTVARYPEYGGYGLQAVAINSSPDDEDVQSNAPLIERGEELLNIPSNLIITTANVLKQWEVHAGRGASDDTAWSPQNLISTIRSFPGLSDLDKQDAVVAIELLVHFCLGKASLFHPYLQVLPKDVPRLDTFEAEELELLQDPMLQNLARQLRESFRKLWVSIQKEVWSLISLIRVANGETTTDETWLSNIATFATFHHYVSIVSSRAMLLNSGDTKYLVPVAGMANYAPRPPQSAAEEETPLKFDTFHHWHAQGDGSITVLSDRPIWGAGEQIMEDYGELDNSLYLVAHGFVPQENPHHCAVISHRHAFLGGQHSLSKEMLHSMLLVGVLQTQGRNGGGSGGGSEIMHPHACIRGDGVIRDELVRTYVDMLVLEWKDHDHQNAKKASARETARKRCFQACATLAQVRASESEGEGDDAAATLSSSSNYKDAGAHAISECTHPYEGRAESVVAMIAKAALRTLNQSPTTLAQDEKLREQSHTLMLQEGGDSEGQRQRRRILALEFRIAEKRVLQGLANR